MVNITLLTCVIIIMVQTQALVQLKTSLASSDNPLLTKILQSIDAATSDEHLLEVTLKLLKSLCVCMRDTLKAKEDTYNSVKLLIGQSESITTEGKVLDLYKKIYNNTCFNLKEDLSKRNNISSETWSHSNCGKNHQEEKEPEHEEVLQKVKKILRSKLDHILYKALVQTRHHHKYKIRKYNLFGRAKSKVKSTSKHTLIVILTLHPAKKDLRKYNVIEEDFHKVLHKNSTIEIDIIDTKYDQKEKESEEAVKPEIYSDCHLQSLYTYLAESEKKNLTKVFRFLRRRDTIKIYIEVFTGRNHTDYINICCTNGTISLSCKKDLVKNLRSEEDIERTVEYKKVDKNKSKTLQNDFRSTISKLKKIVKKLNYKHLNKSSTNSDTNVTDISSNIINKNQIKNVLLKRVPTIKENNPVADQLSLKSNSLPNLVENLSPPLKLQDVSRAIIILNDFVSKQTTANDMKPTAESNQTNNVHINTPNVISREVTFFKKVPTTTIVLPLFDKSTTITNTKTKTFQDTLTIKATKQKIHEFDTNIIQQSKNETELLYSLKFLKTPTSFTPASIPREYVINKSLASDINPKDYSNEIITHGNSIEMVSKTMNIIQSKLTTENYPQKSLWPSKNMSESSSNLSTVNYVVVIKENSNETTHVDSTNVMPERSEKNINTLYILPKVNQTLNKEQNYNEHGDDIKEISTTVPTMQEINLYTTDNLPTFTTFISQIQNATIPTIETVKGVSSETPILNNSIVTNHYNVYTTKTKHRSQLTSLSDEKYVSKKTFNIFQRDKQIFEKGQNKDKIIVKIDETTVIPTNQNTTWLILNNSSKYTTLTSIIKDTINSTLLTFQRLPGNVAFTKLTHSEEEPDLDKTLSHVEQKIVTTTPNEENCLSLVHLRTTLPNDTNVKKNVTQFSDTIEKDPRALFTQKLNIVSVPVEAINNTYNHMSSVNSDSKKENEISQMKQSSEAYAHSKNEDIDKTELQSSIYSPSQYQNEDLTEKYEASVYNDHKNSFSYKKHNLENKDLQYYVTPLLDLKKESNITSSAMLGNPSKIHTNQNGFLTEITDSLTEIKKELPLKTYNTVTQFETLKMPQRIFINSNRSTVFNNHKSSQWLTVAKNNISTKTSPSKTWLSIDTHKVYSDKALYTTTVENIHHHKMTDFRKVQDLLTNSEITDDKSFTTNSFKQKETKNKKVHEILENSTDVSHLSDDSLVSDFKLSKNIQTGYVTVTIIPNTVTSSSVLRTPTESMSTQDKGNNYENLILTKSTKENYVTVLKEVSDSPRIKSLHSSTEEKRIQKRVRTFDKMEISNDSLPFQSEKEIITTNPINSSVKQIDIPALNSTFPTTKRKDYSSDPIRNNKVNFSINKSPIFLTTNIKDLQNAKLITENSIYDLTNKNILSTEPTFFSYSSNDRKELKKVTKAPTQELIKATSTTVTDSDSVINGQYTLIDTINVTEIFESQIEQTAATYEDIPFDMAKNNSRTENTELHFETNVQNKISSDEPLGFLTNRSSNTINSRENITNDHKNQNTITIPIDLLLTKRKRLSNVKYTSQNTISSEYKVYSTTLIPSTDNMSDVQNIDHITKKEEFIKNDKIVDINKKETSDSIAELLSNILVGTKSKISGEPYDEIENNISDTTEQDDFKKTKSNRFGRITEQTNNQIIPPNSHTTDINSINISDPKNIQSFNNIQTTTMNPTTIQNFVEAIGDYTLPEKEITLENIISINNMKPLTTNSTCLPQQIIRTISNSNLKDVTNTIKNTMLTEMNTSLESRHLIESIPRRSTSKIYRNVIDKYNETKTNATLTEKTGIKSNIKQTSENTIKTTLPNTNVKETLNKKFSTDLNAIESKNGVKAITSVIKMKDSQTDSNFINDSTIEILKSSPLELNDLSYTEKGMVNTIPNSINKETLTNLNIIKNTEHYFNISKQQNAIKNALPLQRFFTKTFDSTAKYRTKRKSIDSHELFQTENYDIFKTNSDNTEKKLNNTVRSLNKIQDTQTNLNYLKSNLMDTLKSTTIYELPNTKNSPLDMYNSEDIESDLSLLESTNNEISPINRNTERKEKNINVVNIDKNQNMITKSIRLAQKSTRILNSNMNYISTNNKASMSTESYKNYKTENTDLDTQLKATSNEEHSSQLGSKTQSDSTIQLYSTIPLDIKTTIKNEDFVTYDNTKNDDNDLVKPTAAVKNSNTLQNKSTAAFKQIPNDILSTSTNVRFETFHNLNGIHSVFTEFTKDEINQTNNNITKTTTDAVSSTTLNFTKSDIITKPVLFQPIFTNKMITTPNYISTTIKASMSEDAKILMATTFDLKRKETKDAKLLPQFDKTKENVKIFKNFKSFKNKRLASNFSTNETFIEKNSTEKSEIIFPYTPLATKEAISDSEVSETENSSSTTTPTASITIVASYENTIFNNKRGNKILNFITNIQNGPTEISQYEPNILINSKKVPYLVTNSHDNFGGIHRTNVQTAYEDKKSKSPTESVTDMTSFIKQKTKENYVHQYQTHNFNTSKILNMIANSVPLKQNFTKKFVSTPKYISMNIEALIPEGNHAAYSTKNTSFHTKLDTTSIEKILTENDNTDKYTSYIKNIANNSRTANLYTNLTTYWDNITEISNCASRFPSLNIKGSVFKGLFGLKKNENLAFTTTLKLRNLKTIMPKLKTTVTYGNTTSNNQKSIEILDLKTNLPNGSATISQYIPNNMLMGSNSGIFEEIHNTTIQPEYSEKNKKNTIPSIVNKISSFKLKNIKNNDYNINYVKTDEDRNMITNPIQFQQNSPNTTSDIKSYKGLSEKPKITSYYHNIWSNHENIIKMSDMRDLGEIHRTTIKSASNFSDNENSITSKSKNSPIKLIITENKEFDINNVNMNINQSMNTNPMLSQKTFTKIAGTTKYSPTNVIELNQQKSYDLDNTEISTPHTTLKTMNHKFLSKYDNIEENKINVKNVQSFRNKRNETFVENGILTTFPRINNLMKTEKAIYKTITEPKIFKVSKIKMEITSPCGNTSSDNKDIINVPGSTVNIQNQTRLDKYILKDMTVTSRNRVFKSFYDYKVTDSVIASLTYNRSNNDTTKPLRISRVKLNTTEYNDYKNRNTIDPKQKLFMKMFPSTSKHIHTNIQISTLQVPYAFQETESSVMTKLKATSDENFLMQYFEIIPNKSKAQKSTNNNTFAMDKFTQMPDNTNRSTLQINKNNAFDDLPNLIELKNPKLHISPEPRNSTGIVLKSKTTAIYEHVTGDNKNVIIIPELTTNPSNRKHKISQYFSSNMVITSNKAEVAKSYENGRIHGTVTTYRYDETNNKNNSTIKSAAVTTSSLKLNITENNKYTINEINYNRNNQNMIRNLGQFKGSNSNEISESRNFKDNNMSETEITTSHDNISTEAEYIIKPTYTSNIRDVTSTIFQFTSNCSNKINNTIPKFTKHDVVKVNNEDDNSVSNLERNQNMITDSNLLQENPVLKLKSSLSSIIVNIATFTSKLKTTNETFLSKYDVVGKNATNGNNIEMFTKNYGKGLSSNNITQMLERTSRLIPLNIKNTFVEMNNRKETENTFYNTTPELRIMKPLLIKSKTTTTYENVSSENKHVIKIPDILINVQNQTTKINKYTSNNVTVPSNSSMFLSPYNFRVTNSRTISPTYEGSNKKNNTMSKSTNNAKSSSTLTVTNYNESGKNYINIYETQNMVTNSILLQRNLTKMFESPSKYAPMNTKISLTEDPSKGKKFSSEPKSTNKDEKYMIISERSAKELFLQSYTTVMPNISETTTVSSTLQNEIMLVPKYLLNNMPPISTNKHFILGNAFIESVKKHQNKTVNLTPTNSTINVDNTESTIHFKQDVETNHNFINNNIADTTQSITVDSRPDISNKISDNIVPKQSESKNKTNDLKHDVNIINVNKSRDIINLDKNNVDIFNNIVKYHFPITKEISLLPNYAESTTTTIFDFTFKALNKKQLNKTRTINHNPIVTKKATLEGKGGISISDTILNTLNIRNISRQMNVTKDNVHNFKNTKTRSENSNMSSIKNIDQKNITQTSERALKNTEPYIEDSSQGILHMKEARDEVFDITPKPTYIPRNLTSIEQTATTNYFPSESFSSWARKTVKLPNVIVDNMILLTEKAFGLNSPDMLATLHTKNKVSTTSNAIVEKNMNHTDLKNAQPLISTNMANPFLPSQLKTQSPDSIFSSNAKSDQVTQNYSKVSLYTRLSPIITGRNKLKKQHIVPMKSETEANHLQLQSLLEVNPGTTLRLDKLHSNFTNNKLQENISTKLGYVSTLYIYKEEPVTIAYSVTAQPCAATHKESAATKFDIITDNNQMQNSVNKVMIFNKHKYTEPISKSSNINKKTSQDMQSIGHNGKDDFVATGNQLSRNANNIKIETTETFIEQSESTTIDNEVEKNKSTITSHVNQTTYPISNNSKMIKPDEFQLSIRVGIETTKDRLKFSLVSINQRPENITQLIKSKEKTSTILPDIPFRVNQITATSFKNDHENNNLNKKALNRIKLTRRINKIKDIKGIIPPSTGFKETRLPKVIKEKQRSVTSTKNLITGTVTNGADNNITIEDENILSMGTSENIKKYLVYEKQMSHLIDITDTTDLTKRKHKKISIKPGSLINPLTMEMLSKVYQKHLYASRNKSTEKENISYESNTSDTVQKETYMVNNNSEDDTSTFMGHQVQTSKKERLYNVSHNQKATYFIIESLTTHDHFIKEYRNITDTTNSNSYFQDIINNNQEQNHTNRQEDINQHLKNNEITSTLAISNVKLQNNSNLPEIIKYNNNIFTPIQDSPQPDIKWNLKNETINNLLGQYKVSHKTNRTLFKQNTISPRTTELLKIKKNSYNKKNTLLSKKRKNLVNSLKYKHDIADILRKLVKSKKIDIKSLKLTNKSYIIHNLLSKIRKPTIHINITHTKHKSTTIPINFSYETFIDNMVTKKYKTQIDKPTRKSYSINSYDENTKHYSHYDDQHWDSNSRKENRNYTSINRRFAYPSHLFSTDKLITKSGRKSSSNSFWGIRLIKMSEVINSTHSYKFLNQSQKNVSHQIPPSTFNQIGIKDKITKLVTSKPIISSHVSTLGPTSENAVTFNTIPQIQRRNINSLLTINSNPSKKINVPNKEKYENKTHYITINISIPYVKLHIKSTKKIDKDSKMNTEDYNNFIYPNQSTTKIISSQNPKSGAYNTVRTVLANNTSFSHEYLSLTPNLHILLPITINQKASTSKFLKTLPVIKKNTVSFPSSTTKINSHIDQITASSDNNQHSSNTVFNNSANNISFQENPKHFTEKLTHSSSNMPEESFNQRLKVTDSKNTYTPMPNVQGYLIAPSISTSDIVNNKKGVISNAKYVLRHSNNFIGSTNTDSNYIKQMTNENFYESTTELLKMETNKFYTNEVNATRTSDATKVSKSLSGKNFASLGLNVTVTNTDRPLNQTQIVLNTRSTFSYEEKNVSISEKNIESTKVKMIENNILPMDLYNYSITQVNNVTTDTLSPYKTNYGNILDTTTTPNLTTIPRQYPLQDITSNLLHTKYNTASINRLVNSNIINNYKHFNNRSSYKTEYKYENATNYYSSKSDLKLTTTPINLIKKTENVTTTKTHSDENKFLPSSPRESLIATISARLTDLIDNANTIDELKLNSYPKKIMTNSLDAILLKDKNMYRGPEYNNKTVIGRSTVMKHYDTILNNVKKVEGTLELNILTQPSLTTSADKIKLPQFNNINSNFSFVDKYSTRSILVTQISALLNRYSDSVTNASRSLNPEDTTYTTQNSSINTTRRSDNLNSSNYQKLTSMTPQVTTLNIPSILDLSTFIKTPVKSHIITQYTKLNNFEGTHKNVENISEKIKEILLLKDLLSPNVSTILQKSTFKIPFQITQTPDINRTHSFAVTDKVYANDTQKQHYDKIPLNVTEINGFDRINEVSPKNFSLNNRKSDKASFNMINTVEIPELISTNINEQTNYKSNLPVYTLKRGSKNPIISQIYILEPKNSENIWSRHIRRKARNKSNITKIYQSTDENVVSFTNIVPSTKLDVGLNSTKQDLNNPNSISEFNMAFKMTSVDPVLLQLNSNIPKPIKVFLNSSTHKQESLSESTKRDLQSIIVPRDTIIPSFATNFKDKTRYTPQINKPVTFEKYIVTNLGQQYNPFIPTLSKKETSINSKNTRKIYYTLVSISPNDFMPKLNKNRYLRIPSTTVTKTIKYNTYQPPIKEENESPKYRTKLNPRPNVSCAILKTMRHKFHTTAEFMEFLKASNCSADNLTIHLNIKNNRFTPLPFAVNKKRKINNQLPNIKHPNIKLTKRVFTRIGSKEMVQSSEKTKLFPKRLKTIIPKMQPSIVKRIIIGDSRRKEIISMNTQDFFSQHRLRTPSHMKTVIKPRLKNPFLVKPRVSALRPEFNHLEPPRPHFDKPKTFFLPPRNSEELFPEVYEGHHHQGLNWKQKIGVIREALKNVPIAPLPSPEKMPINNVLDNPLTQIKADWNAKMLRDNTELSKKKIWGPSDFVPLTIAPILQKPVTPFGAPLTPRQFRRNFPLVTHTTKGEVKPVTDWWLDDMYLKVRLPLPINSNPGMVFPRRHFAKMEEVADLGALFIDDILDYKEMLDRGELPLERATSREKGQPLCMEQFYRLLGVCRIPEVGKDRLELPPVKSGSEEQEELVVVACRNYFYPIPVKAADRGRLTPGEIQAQLLHAMVDAAGAPSAPRVGLLTSMNRDQWAKAREQLIKDETNRTNFELISRALCILCLDEAGGDRADTDPETNAMLRAMHGAGTRHHSANRWFDKTVQLIISSDGTVGMCYEHSAAEGVAVVRLAERALARAEVADRPAPPPALLPAPQAMKWNIVPDVQRSIEQAARDLDRAISDLDFKKYTYRGYGREFMKSCRTSPDVYIQLAIQYAYYKMYGYLVTTYESASLRRFRIGRVDNIRSAHGAALAWAAAMCTADTSPLNDTTDEGQKKVSFNLYGEQKKLELFEEAARKQTSIMEANILGKGIDNHLLGLREMARETMGELPAVFCDNAYKQMFEFKMSTSQVATTTDGTFMGYGAVCPDGYGCCYNPKKDSIIFCISSFTSSSVTNTEAYRQSLEEALDSMKLMFQTRKPEN